MPHDLQDLKLRLTTSTDFHQLMGDFLDFATYGDLLERSWACELPPRLEATLDRVIAEVLGHSSRYEGLTLRCDDVMHGTGLVRLSKTGRVCQATFFYAGDVEVGLMCFSGLPGGENRYTRLRYQASSVPRG